MLPLNEKKNEIMTVAEFSKEYKIGLNTVYQIIHTKGFPVFFCGRKALILRTKIEQWLNENIGKRF